MLDDISRRQFLRGTGAGLAGTTLGALGFGEIEAAHAATIRPFKLTSMVETRNTCPYCAVGCGVIMYAPQPAAGGKRVIQHIEGDPDHPTNRGTLCPKGIALKDFVNAPTRVNKPRYRKPGADKFEDVTWDFALDRIAKLLKEDRDQNFIATNNDGVTVNRWLSTGILAASASSNETAFLTYKVIRGMGALAFDNQARV
jgi:formate dehydrogenase major subunit